MESYRAKATIYFYKRLEKIYGAKYRGLYKTEQSLLDSQSEWGAAIGTLSREQIDTGMEALKVKMVTNKELTWPDIAATIAMCRPKVLLSPAHRQFEPSKALPSKTLAEQKAQYEKQIESARRMLKKPTTRCTRQEPKQDKAKQLERAKQQEQLLAEAAENFKHTNQPTGKK